MIFVKIDLNLWRKIDSFPQNIDFIKTKIDSWKGISFDKYWVTMLEIY